MGPWIPHLAYPAIRQSFPLGSSEDFLVLLHRRLCPREAVDLRYPWRRTLLELYAGPPRLHPQDRCTEWTQYRRSLTRSMKHLCGPLRLSGLELLCAKGTDPIAIAFRYCRLQL